MVRGQTITEANLRRRSSDEVLFVIPSGRVVNIDHLSDCDFHGLNPSCPVSYAGQLGQLNPLFLSFK
jgi:hypothetical protein